MTDEEWAADNPLEVLGDELCRRILVIASGSPVSAATLVEQLDVSPPTVYRRVDLLEEDGLIREHHRVGEKGNHYRTFETILDRVEVEITDDGYKIKLHRRQDLADRFGAFWKEFRERTPTEYAERYDRTNESNSENNPSPP